jgi:putative SOS response-associated peptidase YedK
MPMILDPEVALEWLHLEENHLDHAFTLLQPYPAERMEVYQVSSEINASRYDGPEAVTPVADLQ